jgi:hypothetical protein
MNEPPTRLPEIIGEQLSAVSFVQDYVEFHFDGPVLRVYTRPTISAPEGEFRFPEAGSRDALCTAIRDLVCGVDIQEHSHITLHLSSGRKITVAIRDDGSPGPEAFTFQTEPCNSTVFEVWKGNLRGQNPIRGGGHGGSAATKRRFRSKIKPEKAKPQSKNQRG